MTNLTKAVVESLLNYDPETGLFTWRVDRPPRGKAGQLAGYENGSGYIKISLGGKREYAHRLAVLLMTGTMPVKGEVVDHINGAKHDNRWSNIRVVTQRENGANAVYAKNVRQRDSGKWEARFGHVNLGRCDTREDARALAAAARRAAARVDPFAAREASAPVGTPIKKWSYSRSNFGGKTLNAVARENGVKQNELYRLVVYRGMPLAEAISTIKGR
jgi:hypothetical protein